MIPKAFKKFIYDLLSATDSHALSWNEADGSAYFCDHKNYTLHLTAHFDEERGQSSFFFRMVTEGKTTPFSVRDDEEDYEAMRNLYEAVVANANNVEDDISKFFD